MVNYHLLCIYLPLDHCHELLGSTVLCHHQEMGSLYQTLVSLDLFSSGQCHRFLHIHTVLRLREGN